VLAFSDREIIRIATEDFVPVAADDWYQRRRQDEEGKFWMSVAQQGRPREDEGTRQGIYCFTADGKLLAYKNAGNRPDVMRDTIRQGLRDWQKLPEASRKPGAVKVDDPATLDNRFARTPPHGGLIVNVYTRILDVAKSNPFEKGELCRGKCSTPGGEAAARDHLWLTEAEWKGLIPTEAKRGQKVAMTPAVAERILRFHLTDNTRGEPPMWTRDQIRKHEMTLTVEEVTPLRMRLDGWALLATRPDAENAERGFDVRLLGYIGYDRAKQAIDRFDVLAVGDHWGIGQNTRRSRPGRMPLGVAFELANHKSTGDLVPPQAARQVNAYFGRDR
jgi:hypothetical protein